MPHLILEYSENLREDLLAGEVLDNAHATMLASGLFKPADIKTRAYSTADFLVGEKGSLGSFLHGRVYLLAGRTVAQKQALSEALRDSIAAALPTADQISIDIRDLDKDTYRKHVGA